MGARIVSVESQNLENASHNMHFWAFTEMSFHQFYRKLKLTSLLKDEIISIHGGGGGGKTLQFFIPRW